MKSFEHIIKDPMGLHARPAGLLVKEAKKFSSKITIHFNDVSVEAIRMMAVMRLGTKAGDKIIVTIEGEDEADAVTSIQSFFAENV